MANVDLPAKKYLHLSIKERLADQVPELKKFGVFANQFTREKKEETFDYPAAFMSYSLLNYAGQLEGVQVAPVQFKLHIGFTSVDDEDVDYFDILDKIYVALQGWEDSTNSIFTAIFRESEEQIIETDNVNVWVMTCNTFLSDRSAERVRKRILLSPKPDLQITPTHDATTKPRIVPA